MSEGGGEGREAPLTAKQQDLVASALWVVEEVILSLGGGHRLDADELRAIGEDAVIRAARRYDPEVGLFERYAWAWASKKMIGALQKEGRSAKRLRALRAAATQAGLFALLDIEHPAPELGTAELIQYVEGACAGMTVEMFSRFIGGIDQAEGPDAAALREEYAAAIDALREALGALSRGQRSLFERRVLGEVPWKALAAALGVSVSTAQSRFQEVRVILKTKLLWKGVTRAPPGPFTVIGERPGRSVDDRFRGDTL